MIAISGTRKRSQINNIPLTFHNFNIVSIFHCVIFSLLIELHEPEYLSLPLFNTFVTTSDYIASLCIRCPVLYILRAIGIIVEYLSFIIRFSRNIIINSSYYYNYITLLYSVMLFEFQSVIKCHIKYLVLRKFFFNKHRRIAS